MARPYPSNPTGAQRKPKQTPETLAKLSEAFAIDASIPEACMFAEISQDAYYDWVRADPQLGKRFAELRQKPILKARNVIISSITGGNTETSKWYLERKAKNEFAQRSELTGANGGPIQMSQEEIDEVRKMFPNV